MILFYKFFIKKKKTKIMSFWDTTEISLIEVDARTTLKNKWSMSKLEAIRLN